MLHITPAARTFSRASLWLLAGMLAGAFHAAQLISGEPVLSDNLEVVYQLSLPPSSISCAPDGSWIMGVNPAEKPRARAVKVARNGDVKPFPTAAMSEAAPAEPLPLDSISGLQTDADGIIWLVDNGRRSESAPKIIAWNADKGRLQSVYNLASPAVTPASYVAGIAVDPGTPLIYLADPAGGADAAIIVLDRTTGLARRLLQGSACVQPDTAMRPPSTQGSQLTRRLDGKSVLPQCGVASVCLDRKSEWLYFSASQSGQIYRVRTRALADVGAAPEELAKNVEPWAAKPFSSSMAMDAKGNLYVTDLANRGIVVIDAGRKTFKPLLSDPRLLNPDGLCFGQDGRLYFFSPTRMADSLHGNPGSFCLFRVPDLTAHHASE